MVSFTKAAGLMLASGATLVAANSSNCPYNYPAFANTTTSHHGLIFTVTSYNSTATNNKALQLRPNPYGGANFSFVGLDDSSPVLLANLDDGGVYSQERNIYNQLENLGPTAYLSLQETRGDASRYIAAFAPPSAWPGQVDDQWQLIGGPSDGGYNLYHIEPTETANGFVLCPAVSDTANGTWWQLFYYTYKQDYNAFPECLNIGVETTVAATILNGDCNIAGYTA